MQTERRPRHQYVLLLLVTAAAIVLIPGTDVSWSAQPEPLELDVVGRTAAGGEAAAEIAAYDSSEDRAFTTDAAANAIDVYDFSDPEAPVESGSIPLAPFGGGPNSVAWSDSFGGILAVAVEANDPTDPGTVELFDSELARIGSIRVGALPDMVTFTPDGETLLVANEGEPATDGSVDPEGSVSVIDMSNGPDDAVLQTAELRGVPLRGPVRVFTPGTTQAQDLEPEYVTTDGERAWVSIQEANAVGILDVETAEFEVVRSLGFKDHGEQRNALDPSDDDGASELRTAENVFGMYMPDAISHYSVKVGQGRKATKRSFIATANEGDSRAYDYFDEESRVSDLTLDPDAFDPEAINDDELGRLTVTTTLGDRDGDGDYERLYAFGGRSMSIVGPDASLRFDTGSDLERRAIELDAANFNKDNEAGSDVDNRSDNKGPEPEALDTGRVGGHTYSFVGAERSGGVYAYDLSAQPGKARFAGYLNTREDDLGPEGFLFLSAKKSPTGDPALLMTSEITGTLTLISLTPGN